MKREFQVMVRLKDGLADPQGKTIEDALPTMGYTNVSNVRVGKVVHLTVDAETEEQARGRVREIAERLLSNPVIEWFWIADVERGE